MTQHDDAVIVELLSYSLDRLNKEPELLQADSDRLRRQATEQAVAQYGAFLSASECTSSVRREVAGIKEHLEALQEARTAQEGRTVAHFRFCRVCRNSQPAATTSQRLPSASPFLAHRIGSCCSSTGALPRLQPPLRRV